MKQIVQHLTIQNTKPIWKLSREFWIFPLLLHVKICYFKSLKTKSQWTHVFKMPRNLNGKTSTICWGLLDPNDTYLTCNMSTWTSINNCLGIHDCTSSIIYYQNSLLQFSNPLFVEHPSEQEDRSMLIKQKTYITELYICVHRWC